MGLRRSDRGGRATLGEEFVSAVIRHGTDGLSGVVQDEVLAEHERRVWAFVRDYIGRHGAAPARETVDRETGVWLPKVDEPPSYYRDLLIDRYTHDKIKASIAAAKEFLQVGRVKPADALEAMLTVLVDASRARQSTRMVDARGMGEAVYGEVQRVLRDAGEGGVLLGWPYLDNLSGGARAGDLISFVGRPAAGKTFLVLFAARHGWMHHGKRVLFISMEMDPMQILLRLAAMEVGIEARDVKTAQISTTQQNQIRHLKLGDREPFYVVDGNLGSTPGDVAMLARQLRPDVIFVDGGYLMRHPDPKLTYYVRVSAVCDDLKRLAGEARVPVVVSWQFNRQASKKKDDEKVGLEDIAYSDTIGQLSTIVLGMFDADNLGNQLRKRVQLLKGRGGEVGEFHVSWDFRNMDFTQLIEPGGAATADQGDDSADPDADAPREPTRAARHLRPRDFTGGHLSDERLRR